VDGQFSGVKQVKRPERPSGEATKILARECCRTFGDTVFTESSQLALGHATW
jgi:hypothetical protein